MLSKKLLRQLFSFTKTESNGVFILFILIAICLLSPALYKSFFSAEYELFEYDQKMLDSLISGSNIVLKNDDSIKFYLKAFDPNDLRKDELQTMGIPSFLSARIENYVKAGGSFKIKKDLKKIYGMTDSLFNKLEDFIELPDRIVKKRVDMSISTNVRNEKAIAFTQKSRFTGEGLLIDINKGDTSSFKQLYGIGTGYANRIVNFRDALGGFHTVGQLRGMYGMTDSLYHQVRSFLTISDTVELKSIRINTATFKQLLSHPYISYELTQEILITKSKYGKFNKPEDLGRLTKLSADSIVLLLPYISF